MDCYDIKEIDMSDFDFSEVTNMESLFSNCISLTSINFHNIDTSKVKNMEKMFYNCSSLLYVDFSFFDTSNVENMNYMFYSCVALFSIDLSNFDISNAITMTSMFEGCLYLEYLNLQNFNEVRLNNNDNMFKDVPDNMVYCVNTSNNITNIKAKLSKNYCQAISCNGDWKSEQYKMLGSGMCIAHQSCYSLTRGSLREYHGKCISCPNGSLPNDENYCKCELEQCLECPPIASHRGLCSKCNNDYYQKENDPLNLGEFIGCYKNPEGYYLDINESLYKECYYTCEKCEMKGDNNSHNCLECNENYPNGKNISNYLNCYNNSGNLITTIVEDAIDGSSEIIISETEKEEKKEQIGYYVTTTDKNLISTTIKDLIVESSEIKKNETQNFKFIYDNIDEIKKVINET